MSAGNIKKNCYVRDKQIILIYRFPLETTSQVAAAYAITVMYFAFTFYVYNCFHIAANKSNTRKRQERD